MLYTHHITSEIYNNEYTTTDSLLVRLTNSPFFLFENPSNGRTIKHM